MESNGNKTCSMLNVLFKHLSQSQDKMIDYIYNNISIQKKTKKSNPSARVLEANEEDEFNLKEEHPPFLLLGRRRSPPP